MDTKKLVRMNLGCGSKLFPISEGWINVDVVQPPEIVLDTVSEISGFPYNDKEVSDKAQFLFHATNVMDMRHIQTGSIHEIHAYHVVEHFHISELPALFKEIRRVLDPQVGCFVCELPDIIKCAKNLLQVETTKNVDVWYNMGLCGMFGVPFDNQPWMQHKWGWYPASLSDFLIRNGFKAVIQQPALTHKKDIRDFRLVSFVNQMPKDFDKKQVQGAPSNSADPKALTGLGLVNKATGRNEPLLVQPRDSVPEKNLLSHIQSNMKMIDKWLVRTKTHAGKAFIVSAGPSLKDQIPRLKKEFSKERGDVIFCVKHSLPILAEAGITPDFCVVLDPRPLDGVSTHGFIRKELFATIPKETKFLIASMTNVEVTKYLLDRGADVVGWHAYASGIDRFIHLGIKLLIAGGTSAGMRSINIAYNLGFRDIALVSFDSIMEKDFDPAQRMSDVDADGRQKFIEIYYKNPAVKYYSTGELVAQIQDLIATLANPQDIIFDVWAEGLVDEVWKENKQKFDIVEYSPQTIVEEKKVV